MRNFFSQDEAKNVGDAGHQRGFLTKYWLKLFHHKSLIYCFTIPKCNKIILLFDHQSQ